MADARYSTPIDLASSTVLITGGSSGIGFGLARCFVQAGATVIITGRREQQLKEAVQQLNSLGKQKITSEHPQTNILLNNAGIQQRIPFIPAETSSSKEREKEIQINISAPIHLSQIFLQHFRQLKTTSAIINVSSGLAFVPFAFIPIYCATKAALHSFTMSLRYQLNEEIPNIQVYEFVPRAVKTNLGGGHAFGEPLDEYCQSTFERFQKGEQEIGYKRSDEGRKFQSREESDHQFTALNDTMKNVFRKQNS